MNVTKARLIDGYMLETSLDWLASMAEKSNSILELGSFLGRSTRVLCDNTNGKVTAVDLWEQTEGGLIASWDETYNKFCENLKDHLMSHKLFYYRSTTDYAIDTLRKEGKKFDFIFIDADHRYEQVKKDILGCRELLTHYGVISGHDYNWEGVKMAVDEVFPKIKLIDFIWCAE